MIMQHEALAIAKSLAVRNDHFWDDETARVSWREETPFGPCWAVFTGIEKKDLDFMEQWLDDAGLVLLIDGETGALAGADVGLSVLPADLIARAFKPRG